MFFFALTDCLVHLQLQHDLSKISKAMLLLLSIAGWLQSYTTHLFGSVNILRSSAVLSASGK